MKKPGNWYVAKEGNKHWIRRWMGGGYDPRLPKSKFKHCKTVAELEALVIRLNHQEGLRAKERVEIQTAFIPQDILDSFRESLSVAFKNEKDFKYNYTKLLQLYFLNYFINTLSLPDPKQWHKQQEKWGAALLGKGEQQIFAKAISAKTVKAIIQMANRFMAFLNQKLPEEYPLIKFKPLSKNSIKDHEAVRKIDDDEDVGQFIELGDWIQINATLPQEIAPHIRLLYYYGLRRAESLGFESTDSVKMDHLTIKKQLLLIKKGVEPVKDKEKRETPHWFCTPDRCYRLLEQVIKYKMNPDTLSDKWDKLREKLGMSYNLHDFRRTFITRALNEYKAREVQLAVGHTDLRTTMRYAQDDRKLNDKPFKPSA